MLNAEAAACASTVYHPWTAGFGTLGPQLWYAATALHVLQLARKRLLRAQVGVAARSTNRVGRTLSVDRREKVRQWRGVGSSRALVRAVSEE